MTNIKITIRVNTTSDLIEIWGHWKAGEYSMTASYLVSREFLPTLIREQLGKIEKSNTSLDINDILVELIPQIFKMLFA